MPQSRPEDQQARDQQAQDHPGTRPDESSDRSPGGRDGPGDGGTASSLAESSAEALGGRGSAAASPTVRRRVLAAELKHLRRAAGLTHVDIANRLGWQQGKVSKIEGAKQGVGIDAVIALAEVCHASSGQRDRLVELARTARTKGWWEAYGDVLGPEQRTYVGLEADADALTAFAAESVPELLRTVPYAEAVLRAHGGGDGEADRLERAIEVLVQRQRNVLRRGKPNIDVLISESALRRAVGSRQVMLDQFEWLTASAAGGDIALRVIPFSAGALPADCPFSLLEFWYDPHPAVVFVPGEGTCAHVEDSVEVDSFRAELADLRSCALDPDASVEFVREVRREIELGGPTSPRTRC
ncbi:helix-turn-helix transcriptional regulator [Parasphingorhabdus pacifica]